MGSDRRQPRSTTEILGNLDAGQRARIAEHLQAAICAFLDRDPSASVEPVEGLRTLSYLGGIMDEQAQEFVLMGRGAGVAWKDLAGPLGVAGGSAHPTLGPDRLAFLWAARQLTTAHLDPTDRRVTSATVRWQCDTCAQIVTDHGPQHPAALGEEGHAYGCTRHVDDIANDSIMEVNA